VITFIRVEVDGLGIAYIEPKRIMAITADPAHSGRSVIVYDNSSDSPEILPVAGEPDDVVQEIERAVPGAKSFHIG
jgi:hypothetical protein